MEKEIEIQRASSQDERVKSVRMTRRGDRKASKKRIRIEEDERQPVMARLAARWRHSSFVILVMLRKEKHPGEAYVRRGRRKD